MIDNTKWSEIYNKHSKKMLWVCKRYVNDISLAEDLMHEGFIVAMQKQNTFSGFGSFEGWLRTIMVNTSLMYLRKSKNNLFVSDIDISDTTTAVTDMNLTYDNKNKIINTDFSQQELLAAVEAISEHHRIVFNMYVIDKFSHNEIGKTLNIATNTSKSHLLRARKKIQELLLLKANEKEQNKDRRKLFLWFLFIGSRIDSMYAKGFSSFHDSPSEIFNIKDVIEQQNLPDKITSGYIFGITLQKLAIAAVSIVLVTSVFYTFSDKKSKTDNTKMVTESVISLKNVSTHQGNQLLQKDSMEIKTKVPLSVKKDQGIKKSISVVTTPQKKPNKKLEDKQPVVIKKIIDTVYVYK